jgi:preprotein translocase subunit SecG
MEKFTLIVHILTGIAIIGMILLQQGKGAEAGASFGSGASQTAILATVFFITSFGLAVIAKDRIAVTDEILPSLEAIEESIETDLPEIDISQESSDLPE